MVGRVQIWVEVRQRTNGVVEDTATSGAARILAARSAEVLDEAARKLPEIAKFAFALFTITATHLHCF